MRASQALALRRGGVRPCQWRWTPIERRASMAAGPGPGVANSALVLSWAIINFHDSVNPALPHWQPYPGGPRNLKRAGRTWFPRTKAADDRPDSRRTPGLDRRP